MLVFFMKDDGLHDRGGRGSFLPWKGCTLEQFEFCTVFNYSLYVYLCTVCTCMFLFAVPIDFSFLSAHIISFM